MKKLIIGLMFFSMVNIISTKAQPLKISTITIGNRKENKTSEMRPMKRHDYITKEQDIKEDTKAEAKRTKEFNKIYKKEIRKIKRVGRKYENKHGLNAKKHKEKTGL